MAWVDLNLACFAEPPALSPSTIKSSVFSIVLLVQSTNLPGNLFFSFIDFLSNFFIFDKSVLNKARSISISISFNDSLLLLFNEDYTLEKY